MESCTSLTDKSMMGNGKTTKCTAMESSITTKTLQSMKDVGKKIRSMVQVNYSTSTFNP